MEPLLEKHLAAVPIVVVDTETTGLSPAAGHRIVEVGAVRLEGWQEVGQLDCLVNPARPMERSATRVHGLCDADVADAPSFQEIVAQLDELADGAVLVAHNAPFDAGFLAVEYSFAEQQGRSTGRLPNAWLCTLQLARRHFCFGGNSLANVAQRLGVRRSRAHRALGDVYTTIAIFQRMAQELAKRNLFTVGDLLHAQGGPIYMPPPPQVSLPSPLAEALATGKQVRINYVTERGSESCRVVSPLYPTERGMHRYLVAYCHLRRAQRTFRLDRILHAEVVEI